MGTEAPLAGVGVVEFAGIGPGPYAGMLLADLGARVIKIERVDAGPELLGVRDATTVHDRGKESIALDLKAGEGVEIARRLVASADVLIEGFRPGVMERIGLGPAELAQVNPALVYGRVTGWGQTGPLSQTAGHDIDYIGVAGVLGAIGDSDPVIPLNLVGDYAGGSLFLVLGVLAGLLSARRTGVGTVVDAAMVDGAASLTSSFHGLMASGHWSPRRRTNLLDGKAPFYDTYETRDGAHVAVGALEPRFFAELVDGLGMDTGWIARQYDPTGWDDLRRELARRFAARTRAEWEAAFEGSDACVAPVLSLEEAAHHEHMVERETFVEVAGVVQPAPAPRLEGFAPRLTPPPTRGAQSRGIMVELGYPEATIDDFLTRRIVG